MQRPRDTKSGFIDKLIARIGKVRPEDVQAFIIELVREKGFLEKVFESLQEGLILTDTDGTINYINPAAGAFFGLDVEEAVDRSIESQIRGLNWSSLVAAGEIVSRDMEIFYPENRYLNFYLAPLEDEKPERDPLGFVMIIHDITMNRRLTEEKIESERMSALTLLAAGVAHEIGNPLNSLNIHLQLIERKLRKAAPEVYEKEIRELLDVTREEITRLNSTVEQFLQAIRPADPQLELTDINTLVEESVRFLGRELQGRGIRVRVELRSNIPPLPLDANQMKQAFYNVIRNAMQAMSADGELSIRSDMDDYEITISFSDTGQGISRENMRRIFEPYFTTKRSGTGLGLLIVRRIVREHGGEIELVSRKCGGARLVVHLPRMKKELRFLESGAEHPAEGEASSEPSPSGNGAEVIEVIDG